MADGQELSQYELLQLMMMSRMASGRDVVTSGTGMAGEISPADVLRVVLILVDILGLQVDAPSLVPEVIRRLKTGLVS